MRRATGDTSGFSVIELALTIVLLGIVLAVLVPPLIRAKIRANEAQAVADTRAVIEAEQAFASANGGYFDDVRNLCRTGDECNGISIPGYPAGHPEFLRGDLGRFSPYIKDGYERRFIPGLKLDPPRPSVSATSLMDYCYASTPTVRGLSGVRSFSGSATGALVSDPTGALISCPAPTMGCIFE